MNQRLSSRWKLFIAVAFVLGLLLRTLYVEDMEYKEDEQINFTQSQLIGHGQSFPWVGMPSGVYIANPGMSVWIFAALARVSGATTPTGLARALELFSLLGIALLLPFISRFLRPDEDREPWLWALVLSLVNPFAILYERKLWPEPFLPFFTMCFLMGFWRRELFWGAFAWGALGPLLGQIHMSGFFMAAGFALWTLFFARRGVDWKGWFTGSVLGSLPLLPWLHYILTKPAGGPLSTGFGGVLELKYWVFWLSDPLGLHLGNPLGLLRGNSHWDQISDFVRYPLWGGHATYVVGLAHALILVLAVALLFGSLGRWLRARGNVASKIAARFTGRGSPTELAESAALFGEGTLLTLSTVNIRRYYMVVHFPLEFVWLARASLARLGEVGKRRVRLALFAIFVAEAVISAGFVHYVHVHGGATQGDYGTAYHLLPEAERGARITPNSPPQ